ncbi:ABC transporter ATP-binding protein [Alistipes sp. CHKCI003]|uniref:ABC transporter ATP-binding protein n=1 Tax=Alistipes sp. CHKCI003 TaxID=1780376 RepID=UPI0007A802EE|nr:ABC transporter ATP-binding protein [Alistipes sp. CHKCI003]CVI71796.1 Putative multidrug export ATP-binding/permease protein [Alistipes sp. CHKCI003]
MFKTYIRLLGFASPISKYAVPYFFYAVFYALFNTINFVLIIPILSTLFDPAYRFEPVYELPSTYAVNQETFSQLIGYLYTHLFGTEFSIFKTLVLLAATVMTTSLLSNTFRYLSSWTVENLRTRSLQRMRNQMFDKVIGMNVGYLNEQRKGDIVSRITQDVMVVQFCITNTLQVAFREPLLIIGYLAAMFMISWELSIFSIVFLPLVALLIGSIVKRLRHPARTSQERMGDMVSTLDEALSGIKVIKSYNATEYVKRKFHAINAEFSRLQLSMVRRQQLASPMSEFLGISAAGVILVFGGMLVIRGSLDAGGFVAFLAMFSQITRPVRSFIDQFATINQGIAAGERIFEVLDSQPEIQDRPDARTLDSLREGIEFRNVHFTYDGSREVIDGISFRIRRGETVALVGPSGGGKSTLSELIPRFYDATSGDILIDGIPIRDYTQESLRAHMSVVAQNTVLFNDTIESNIAMGKPSATHDEIVAAAKVANAHDFIMETPEGYRTNIGDCGSKLSGGQRQRLSIARAVLKNPEILILDEATSALDTESEKLVQDALNALLEGRTSVVIAHRLSTIHNADRIIVVDHGRIAEQGTHAELMARNGIYAKLIEMQSFD